MSRRLSVMRRLLVLGWLVCVPQILCAQADTSAVGIGGPWLLSPLRLTPPGALRSPWLGAPRLTPGQVARAWDSTVTVALDSVSRERAISFRLANVYGKPLLNISEDSAATAGRSRILGFSRDAVDLDIDGQTRLELRTERLRNERCSPVLLLDPNSGCRGSFTPPRLDARINVRTGGTIGRRVHVNVDYDDEREFNANNNVQVYYQGLEDEIVRRVDIGTVVFQPPPSRFITAAVPASNFGVNAAFEIGAVQLQAVAATQKGSVVAERTYTIGQTTSQAQDRQARDLDFETNRFFWVVDPDSLPGFPAVDILNLTPNALAPTYQPAQVRVYRYRATTGKSGVNPNLGGITALASRSDGPQTFGPVRWELLIQGTDYYLNDSGLWIALANKLEQNDYLAVSYQTAAGTLIGTFPESDKGLADVGGTPQARDTLELIVQPQQGPSLPTFRHEMRQIYRVAGADLDPASLQVSLSLNRSERPLSGNTETYLAQLGLAQPSDAALFDRTNRLFPRSQDPDAAQILHDSYIVFPHLRPFADPTRLVAAELSDSLYRTPLFLLLSQGPPAKFALRLQYNASGGGDRSTLDLNALQIRDNSEQLFLGNRKLIRGEDYSISYDVGQVTFLHPETLFGSGTAQVTAKFEERGVFAVAPTTILGMSTRYSLGDRGAVNLIGLYQREQSAFTRPALGFEASANLIAGINTELHFKPTWLTSGINSLVTRASTAPSAFDVNAELAFTKPDPSRSGQAYLEEFEGDAGVPVTMRESQWEFGSRPQEATGLEDVVLGQFDPADAVALTWQNLIPSPDGGALQLRPQDIDTLIRLAGRNQEPETIMYLTLHADTAGGIVQRNNASRWSLPERDFRPRWRSMVTPLSSTGVDLSNDDFLEFWLFQPTDGSADAAGLRLVFDLGSVSEDAVAIAPDTFAVNGADTVFTGRQYVGQGRLDTERTEIGIFNAETDDIGILADRPDSLVEAGVGPVTGGVPLCSRPLSSTVPVFPWGDLSARCTNRNGVLDTEDLNGDAGLDLTGTNENVFRYIVDLAAGTYFVRNGVSTTVNGETATWKLYRIPIRQPSAVLNSPNLRLAQNLRITLVTPQDAGGPDPVVRVAMARLRFVGSPWVRRSDTPILGLTGAVAQPHGEVSTSVISTENSVDLGYTSPPGVFDATARRGGDRETQGTQINEKSLRILATDLRLGERAEASRRFVTGAQNLLTYRTLHVWMRGRGAGWEEGDLQAYLKLGSDNDNFYLYRAPAKSTTWEPEFVIDLEKFRALRADVENRYLSGQPASGAEACGTLDTGAYVACDGPYLVNVRDPGVNPPNLAAVQEVSAGIFRVAETVTAPTVELWVDDVRLSDPVSQTGLAGSIDARLIASDVGSFSLGYVRQNGQFRQINETPSYRGSGVLQAAGNLRLERFLPTGLGLAMPLTVSYARTATDPELLTGTDIRGGALSGFRKPDSHTATATLNIRRSQPGTSWLVKGLVDPLSLGASVSRGRSVTELSEARANAYSFNLSYLLSSRRKGFRLPLGGLVKVLPGFVRRGEVGKSLGRADFSVAPTRVRLASGLTRDASTSTAFRFPVARDDDGARPTLALNHFWRNTAGLTWQPLAMLNLNGDLTSTRDLRLYPDSTPIGRLAYNERRFLLGVPVGVERDRTLTTALSLTPNLASWLRPRFLSNSNFVLSRTLASRDPVREEGDSGAFILPQTLNNSRSNELGAALDLAQGVRLLLGDSSGIAKALSRVRPVDVSTRLTRTSTYDLSAFDPGVKYQLGLGGLESFLQQEGADARAVSEARVATLNSGADLPYGISFTLTHSLTRITRLQRVAQGLVETETRQREFPAGNVRWSHTFRGGPLALLAVTTAFRHREAISQQANATGPAALSSTLSLSITPDMELGFRNGISLTLGGNVLDQDNLSNGNEIQLDQHDASAALSYRFRLPESFSRSRKAVRSSFSYLQTAATSCLLQAGESECRVISDVRRREMRGGLDMDLLQALSGGLQVGWSLNDVRHLSQRTSQISVIASFQLSLFSGDYR